MSSLRPEEDPRIVLVLAGNYRQFQDWCRERELNPNDKTVVYAHDLHSIRGYTDRGRPVEVVTTGSWGSCRNAEEILYWARHVQHLANTRLKMRTTG